MIATARVFNPRATDSKSSRPQTVMFEHYNRIYQQNLRLIVTRG